MNRVMVVSAARSPLGAFCGQLESLSEQELAAAAMQEAVKRAGIEPAMIDEVIVGIGKQTSKPSNGGRHAMLLARLPEKIPAYTVQRQSASGLQALANGYWAIRCGDAGVVLAGGAESMSQIPFEIRNSRYVLGCEIVDAIPAHETGAQPAERYGLLTGACAAADFTQRFCFSPAELDAFAAASLERAASAADRGDFRDELFPVTVRKGKTVDSVDRDELPKKAALLAPPADGAAMCILASQERAAELKFPILAEIVSVGIAAVDPRYAAMAAAKAGLKAIGRAGLTLAEVDLIELNEMSAAECLAIMREWQAAGVTPAALAERINPAGGALAGGNPWGAAGALLVARAVHALRRRGRGTAMVALTAEGGQGMAMVLRRGT